MESLVSLLRKKGGLDCIYLVTPCGRALESVVPRMSLLRQRRFKRHLWCPKGSRK